MNDAINICEKDSLKQSNELFIKLRILFQKIRISEAKHLQVQALQQKNFTGKYAGSREMSVAPNIVFSRSRRRLTSAYVKFIIGGDGVRHGVEKTNLPFSGLEFLYEAFNVNFF